MLSELDGTKRVDILWNAFLASARSLKDNEGAGAPRLRIIAQTPAIYELDLAEGAAL